MRARKKDTGKLYALKIMDKKFIKKEKKAAYVKLERLVLDQLDHPGIIRLFFTFQDDDSLCKQISIVQSLKFPSFSELFHLFFLVMQVPVRDGGKNTAL